MDQFGGTKLTPGGEERKVHHGPTQVAVVTQRLNALAAAFQISYAGLIRL